MYSLSKTPISIETAAQIVAKNFGHNASLHIFEELKDGLFNAAYLLELADGMRYVLKVAPPAQVRVLRYEEGIMQAEVEALRLVKEHTEMPVPAVLVYDISHTLLDNEYFLMEYVPGVPLNKIRSSLSAGQQYAIDYQTGDWLRQVNSIYGKGFGLFAHGKPSRPTWRKGFDGLLKDILADGEDFPVELSVPYAEIYSCLGARYAALDEVTTPCLVHWDLWDGNIFIDPQTLRITGILDFERALWADPLMEVNFGAFGENPAFLAGYGGDMLDTPTKKCRRVLYNIYLFLIMVIECYYRHYQTKDQENWARGMLKRNLEALEEYQL